MKHKSRAARYEESQQEVESAKTTEEDLRDELETWRDGLPANLQQGTKADELQSAIEDLDAVIASLYEAAGIEPDFPVMCG